MKKPVMILADFDDTLIKTDSFAGMMKKEKWYLNPAILKAGVFLAFAKVLKKNEIPARNRMKYLLLQKYMELPVEKKNTYAEWFRSQINHEVIQEINQCPHDLLVIISASEAGLIRNVLSDVLACDMIIANELGSDSVSFRTCYGEEKVRRLKDCFPEPEKYDIIVWTDSESDRPIMNLAREVHLVRSTK